jgi:hypothetical protein
LEKERRVFEKILDQDQVKELLKDWGVCGGGG